MSKCYTGVSAGLSRVIILHAVTSGSSDFDPVGGVSSRSAVLERDIATCGVRVCLSVCQSLVMCVSLMCSRAAVVFLRRTFIS